MHKSLILLLIIAAYPTPVQAAPVTQGSPAEVIGLINDYRAQNGLHALTQNPILMQTAQGQADWLISQAMGTVADVHEGPGGTRPKDRAYNAGYGGGSTIFISEIVKGGLNETPPGALAWWKTSPPHNNTMLSSQYVEIGAGAATDGNGRWWFVAVTGSTGSGAYVPPSSSENAAPAAPVIIPVTKADPQPDGSIVHIVRTGQAMWNISAVYDVPLEQLLQLNGNNETIYPGDEIFVAPPGSAPTVEPTVDPNATAEPTATDAPAATPTSRPTEQELAALNAPAPQEPNLTPAQVERANSTVKVVVGVALASILGVVVASFFIQRPRVVESSDEDPFAPIE
ncbi:MAG: CAP domain-containing protein [Anaerolineales bacterium]